MSGIWNYHFQREPLVRNKTKPHVKDIWCIIRPKQNVSKEPKLLLDKPFFDNEEISTEQQKSVLKPRQTNNSEDIKPLDKHVSVVVLPPASLQEIISCNKSQIQRVELLERTLDRLKLQLTVLSERYTLLEASQSPGQWVRLLKKFGTLFAGNSFVAFVVWYVYKLNITGSVRRLIQWVIRLFKSMFHFT
ncbi:hypothetical protein SJAG_02639 [Schizosaccharomyces japonicus yFS275]|uniref:Uncharacterized protein n=1 Tax=Schizosaccharomyces japonicus (strain yFS275 / FY16936) TaxID=402676 RepID=B6K0S6_SCHJY|nr:hypothetical protein SJAG_02639 [Schizosaccharomyces japonicus yFS275]EEB07547.2 hypothetical protein SJAG_02639 [Schizosaccharomyces japonicus yFS275]